MLITSILKLVLLTHHYLAVMHVPFILLSASGSNVYVSARSADYSNWSFNGYLYDSADGATSLSFNQNYYSDTIGLSRYGYRHLYLYGTITDTDTNQNCTIDSEGGINITHYY